MGFRVAFPSNTSSDRLYEQMLSGADLFGARDDKKSVPELPFMALLSPGNTPYEIDRVNIPAPLPLKPQSHYAKKPSISSAPRSKTPRASSS